MTPYVAFLWSMAGMLVIAAGLIAFIVYVQKRKR